MSEENKKDSVTFPTKSLLWIIGFIVVVVVLFIVADDPNNPYQNIAQKGSMLAVAMTFMFLMQFLVPIVRNKLAKGSEAIMSSDSIPESNKKILGGLGRIILLIRNIIILGVVLYMIAFAVIVVFELFFDISLI